MKGGKARPSRSIKQIFELFKVQKSGLSGAKRLFDTLERTDCPKQSGRFALIRYIPTAHFFYILL